MTHFITESGKRNIKHLLWKPLPQFCNHLQLLIKPANGLVYTTLYRSDLIQDKQVIGFLVFHFEKLLKVMGLRSGESWQIVGVDKLVGGG
jgi:hypothetical protein